MFNLTAMLNIAGVNTSSVNTAVNQVNTQLNRGTRSAHAFSDALALRGINLGAYALATTAVFKLTSAIGNATSDAIRFELELAKIAQTVDLSNKEVGKHADSIRKMSVAYGLSAPKIAETIRVLSQAGYSFREAKAAADSLSQTTLLSSFDSISDSTDGLIAVNKQFKDTMGQSAKVLAIFNTVAKKYAVESSDLVEATRKAGGVFSSTGGKLEELAAIFTVVRDTTRESAETVATALRTVFTRLQRPQTIEDLREYGIELTNLKGDFIGNYEAIQEIQKGLERQGIKKGSIKFAEVVEKVGGVRQQSTVIPLLTEGPKLIEIYNAASGSLADSTKDAAKVQETLSFQLAQTQQNFAKLISEISETQTFKAAVTAVLSLANAFASFASSLKEVIPLLGFLGAFRLGRSITSVLTRPSLLRAATTGQVGSIRLARGGKVGDKFDFSPSGTDTVPAMLTPGEVVVAREKAQAFGYSKLAKINRDGYLAKGGTVGDVDRNVGDVVTTLDQAKSILKDFFSSFTAEIQAAVAEVKVTDISGKPPDPRGSITRGSYSRQTNKVGVNLGNAPSYTVAHEGGHAIDAALAGGGGKVSSEQPGSFQNQIALAAKSSVEAQVKSSGASEKTLAYRTKEAEIFADLLAKSSPAVRRILTSTIDAAEGSERLAQYLAREGANEGRLYGDIQKSLQDRVKAIKAGIIAEEQAKLRSQQPQQSRPIREIAEIGRVTTPSNPAAKATNRAQSVAQAESDRKFFSSVLPAPGGLGRPGSQVTIGPVQGPPRPAAGGLGYPGSHNVSLPSTNPAGTFGPFRHQADKSDQLTANFGAMAAVVAGVTAQYAAEDSALAKFSPGLAGAARAIGGVVVALGVFQAALASAGITASAGELVSGIKNLANFGGGSKLVSSFGGAAKSILGKVSSVIPKGLGGGSKLAGVSSSVGGFFAKSGATPLATGIGNKLSSIGGGQLAALNTPAITGAAAVGAGMLAAGGAALAFGKILDGTRDLEGKKNKAIAEGSIAEAGRAAVAQQAQNDLTNFAAVVAATASAIPVVGPLIGAIAGVGIKLAGLIPGVEGAIVSLRDFGASLGLLESSALIAARAESQAASAKLEAGITKRQRGVDANLEKLGRSKDTTEYFNTSEFKDSSFGLIQNAAVKKKESAELQKKLNEQGNTGTGGQLADSAGQVLTLGYADSLAETAAEYEKQIEKNAEEAKADAQKAFGQHSTAFNTSIEEFVAKGGSNWDDYINSLPKMADGSDGLAKQMILLSGEAENLKTKLKITTDIAAAEAAQRKLAFDVQAKATAALAQLESAALKATKISALGDLAANLASGKFQASSLSRLSASDTVGDQTSAAKRLGIDNYDSIVNTGTKAKSDYKKAVEQFQSGKDGAASQGNFDKSLKNILLESSPDITQEQLDKSTPDQLKSMVEDLSKSGDVMKETLTSTAKAYDDNTNKYVDALNRGVDAQLAYNDAQAQFGDTKRGQQKDLEGFSSTGSTLANIRDRRSSIGVNRFSAIADVRTSAVSGSASLRDVSQQLLAPSRPQDSEATFKLEGDFIALQTATRAQIALIEQDTQARGRLIDSLKEELALESSRAKAFSDINKALSGELGSKAQDEAERVRSSAGDVENSFRTGGAAAAINELGSAADSGISSDQLKQFLSVEAAAAIDQESQRIGASRAGGGDFGAEATRVARTGFTGQGSVLAGDISKQQGEQNLNTEATLAVQDNQLQLLLDSAHIFEQSIGTMGGMLNGFSSTLDGIVNKLANTSIAMTLPTTQVVVTLNGAEALAGFQKEMQAFVMQTVSDSLMAQKQGQV